MQRVGRLLARIDTVTDERISATEALLLRAGDAHHVFERDQLNGVYDDDWPAWYARWAVEHGLGPILGRPVDADEVAAFFTRTWSESEASEPKPTEPWATWMARRIVAEL